jgi:hypothetical protein
MRTNPEFTGTVYNPGRFNTTSDIITDAASPQTLTLPTSGGNNYFYFTPNSPYTTNYPSTDSVYSLSSSRECAYSESYLPEVFSQSEAGIYPPGTSNINKEVFSAFYLQYATCSQSMGTAAVAGGFTLECWVYVPQSNSTAGFLTSAQNSIFLVLNNNNTVTAQYCPFYQDTNEIIPPDPAEETPQYWRTTSKAFDLCTLTSTATVVQNSWNHIAVTCNFTPQKGSNTGSVNLFINGTRVGQELDPVGSSAATGVRTDDTKQIGFATTHETTGIRFVAGVCLSVDNFTPPVSKLTGSAVGWNNVGSAITGASCIVYTQYSRPGAALGLIDYSKYKFNISNTSAGATNAATIPVLQSSSPALLLLQGTTNLKNITLQGSVSYAGPGVAMTPPQQRLYFNNQILSLPNGQDFTVNFFIYRTASSTDTVWSTADSGTNSGMRITVNTSSAMILQVGSSTSARLTLANAAAINTWYYVQFSRTNNVTSRTYKLTSISSSGTVYTADYTAASTGNAVSDTVYGASQFGQLNIGTDYARTPTAILNGHIVDYRVTAGMVRSAPSTFPTNFHAVVAPPPVV